MSTKVITRKGEEGQLVYNDSKQTVSVKVGDREYVVTDRRGETPKVKNDIILNDADLQHVRGYMQKFIKSAEAKSKGNNKNKRK